MKKKKLLFIFGTRPEALKMAPLILLSQSDLRWKTEVCFTGQHREMAHQVLELFKIKPHYDLDVMQPGQSLALLTERLMHKLDALLAKVKPDAVVVQGDTTSAFIGGLAAFYHKIPVAHIEAGLRSHDIYQPFPEEINRACISQFAEWNFAPTRLSAQNLLRSGTVKSKVWITGNTVVDALKLVQNKLDPRKFSRLKALAQSGRRIIGVTTHRRENFGKPLLSICDGILNIARKHTDAEIAWLLHLNPQVQTVVKKKVSGHSRIHLLPPLDYLEFLSLMKLSFIMISDSGGVQEEAPSLGKPVLVLRNVTERPEGVQAGVTKLVGTDSRAIFNAASRLLNNSGVYAGMVGKKNPYGDGTASKQVLRILARHLCQK